MPVDDLEQRIDTNKKNGMETQEIINFLNNDANVQELGKRLETSFNSNWLDHKKNQKFHDAINNATLNNRDFQTKIQNKVKGNVGGLTNSDIFLLYLQSKIDGTLAMKPIISKKGDIYTRYGGQLLLNYIRSKYKNPKYEFWRGWPNILPKPTAQSNNPKKGIEIQKKEPELPNNISFDTFGENNTHMPKEFSKLDTRAKENFSTEYNKEKIASRKRNAEKGDKINDYIQYDLLIFSLKKYQELIEKQNNGIINGLYGNEQQYKLQQNLAKSYFEDLEKINKEFPDIQDIINNISNYFKDLEKLQKKHLKNEKEEDVQKKYESYVGEVNQRGEKLGMKEAQESLKKEPKSGDDAIKYWENFNKLMEFENEKEGIKRKYGKSIDNYENYLNEKGNLITKYGKENLQQWINTYKQYLDKINECKNQNKQFDENKYKLYTHKLSESGLSKHFENIQALYNSINTKYGIPKNFPIRGIVEENERLMREQEETNRDWEKIKNTSGILYTIVATGAAIINTYILGARNSGAKLGATISYLWHDDDEMAAVFERVNNGFWNPRISYSSGQMKELYDAQNKEINFNRDNGPIIIGESIGNMLLLVEGGGAITKGLAKGAAKLGTNMGTKLARGAGLVSSSFIQGVGNSFQEGFNAGMTGNQALLYGTTSALIQGSLELISPNEFINGVGKNLAKTYIKELLKTGSKQSLKAIGKAFLKNIGSEIFEENIQEAIQLVAGNLVNMWANDQYNIPKDNELGADRHRKNFTATALVTALTTGIVAGGGFAMQTPGMGNKQSKSQLIEGIKKNKSLHSDVMNVLEKAIAGNIKIPNVNIQQLEDLKLELNNKSNSGGHTNSENTRRISAENTGITDTENTGNTDIEDAGNTDTENTGSISAENTGSIDTENAGSTDTENTGNTDIKNGAVNNILENTNLDMDIIYDIAAEHDITNKAIQDLIIICENNNLMRKIHILLKCCSENSNYEKLTKNEIEQRCNSIIKAIKNNISIDSIQEILYTYRNSTLEIINEIEKKVKENNNEQQKIQEYKNKLKDKYKNPKISPIIERILNNRDLPKEIIFYIDEIIGENPSEEVCISFEKYINEINLNEFTLSTTKIILKNKLGINNRENDIIGFLGLEKKGNGYTFNVDNDLKDIITNLYGTEIGETIIQKIGKELREQDLKNIQNILKKASKIININEIEPHKLILFYQNILDSDRDAHWLNTLSPEQCALILNNTKSKFIPKEILEIITEYTSIPRILNNGDNQTDLTKTMENYIETQQTNADTPCVRVEGFMPGRSKNDNFGGCLKSVNLGNEFGGKSMDIVLKYINGIQDETEKIKELKKLRNSILKNNYTATNERFMSCSLTGIGLGQHLGKDGIMRNFTIKKGTKALFLQGINTKGEDSIYEILVQKNSKIKITDISYAENHFIIYADVTN